MESNTDDYLDRVRKDHQEKPQEFFVEILQILWGDKEENETDLEWKRHCIKVRWYAEDALACFEKILADPPCNLAELMQNEGAIMLDSGAAPYTVITWYHQEYYEFLRATKQRFRKIFEETKLGNG